MSRLLMSLLWGLSAVAASEADAWAQGRPAEALPALVRAAEQSGSWQDWHDAGLCAADAGQRGAAIAYLFQARRLAPGVASPRQALAALDANVPALWNDRLGPISWPGLGWYGVIGMLVIGFGCGLWLVLRPRDVRGAFVVGIATLVVAPGVVAGWLDAQDPHRIALRETQLLDATGNPTAPVAEGAVLRCTGPVWADRIPVLAADGRGGFVNRGDVR